MMIPPTMKVFHHSTGAANQALLQFTGFNAATTISGLWANERSIHTIKGPGSTSNPAHVLFHWTADTHY
jgi:hypothetical protein